MSSTTANQNPHFAYGDYDVFRHRPHKTLYHFWNALAATAVFRIWPSLLFIGGWSTMVVLVNKLTSVKLEFPNTMITVLGVLLGLTLSYRTSSGYEKYSEGRKMWSQITLASRGWARTVWLHCPDSVLPEVPEDPELRAQDVVRGAVEKKTMVQMALAFAVAVKHYLRHEEGIYYEDLYHLVSFIPGLDLPSAMPEFEASIAAGLPTLSAGARAPTTEECDSDPQKPATCVPHLLPAENAPRFHFRNLWPGRFFGLNERSKPRAHAHHQGEVPRPQPRRQPTGGSMGSDEPFAFIQHSGYGRNVPLEIVVFMSSWISTLQRRKTIDVATTNQLLAAISQFNEALVSLERILTTPIPWSYNAHILEVAWIYVLALPFQLYASKFGWVTIPATMVTTYIVMGYASIAEEIENPFNFDRNDLNLGYFCREIIAKELDAITARPPTDPFETIFSSGNRPLGCHEPPADQLANAPIEEVRARLRWQRRQRRQYPPTRANSGNLETV